MTPNEEVLVVGFILFLFVYAYANVSSTTMTWFVATAKSMTVTYGSPCSSSAFFFSEANAQFDPDSDGNASRVVPQATRTGAGDTNCQSATQSALTVNNTGTAVFNADGNFATHLTGSDINVVLKVWQGTGSGCGTDGLGGWEANCTIAERDATTAPTTTTCRNFNVYNDINGGRVVTNLGVFASQQLCFSGDFNGFVSAGDHNATFRLGTDFS